MTTEYILDGYVDFRFVEQLVTNGSMSNPYIRFPEMIIYKARPDVPAAAQKFKHVTITFLDHDAP